MRLIAKGCGVSFGGDEKCSKIDCSDGWTIPRVC